jgi:hypothetical protein
MSDLPPEEPRPQPAGGSEAPRAIPKWAAPAVSPAPEIQASAAACSPPSPTAEAEPISLATAPAVAPAPVQGAPTPPAGWYMTIPQPHSANPSQAPAWPMPSAQSGGVDKSGPLSWGLSFDRARWLPTLLVAAIIAAVTLGGIGLDAVIAAPSAGTVAIGGSVKITAAPGWVLVSKPGDTSGGIQLQKANAILTAQVVSTSFGGGSASILQEAEKSIGSETAQVSYGDPHHGTFGGNDSTYVSFEATVTSGNQTGIVDGELVCMVVQANETIVVVAAPQGHLDPVIDDVSAMLNSLRAGS